LVTIRGQESGVSLEGFKNSAKGAKLAPILTSEDAVRRMIGKSEAGRPAVEAIGPDVIAAAGALDDGEKKMVGRWVKEVLAPRGWTPDRKGRVARGHAFARGTIYRRTAEEKAQATAIARLDEARRLVRLLPYPIGSVDDFLAARRAMWGEDDQG
jgi:hypothetical protein